MAAMTVERGDSALSYRQLVAVAQGEAKISVGAAAAAQIKNGRAIVERIIASGERAYGISTGLGALSEIMLTGAQQAQLSRNTLMSHACGVGTPLTVTATRAIMASLVNENNFTSMYQQGENFSTLMINVDENSLLVIVFPTHLTVGSMKYYAGPAVRSIGDKIVEATKRGTGIDLSDVNATDIQVLFQRKD